MKLILVSGDGIGAGKTTLASRLADQTWSLAGALREELTWLYPDYNWWDRTQVYKAETKVRECGGKTVRDVLIEHGQAQCAKDPLHYVRKLADKLAGGARLADGVRRIAVDDLRKVIELEYLREKFPDLLHYHVVNAAAGQEQHFQNDDLRARADYQIEWKKKEVS